MDQPFHMIKFRSMIPDAEKHWPSDVNESGDSRYIKEGQFHVSTPLMNSSVVELLVGDMSLVVLAQSDLFGRSISAILAIV